MANDSLGNITGATDNTKGDNRTQHAEGVVIIC